MRCAYTMMNWGSSKAGEGDDAFQMVKLTRLSKGGEWLNEQSTRFRLLLNLTVANKLEGLIDLFGSQRDG